MNQQLTELKQDYPTTFVFKKAQSPDEYCAIYQSRLDICKNDFPYMLDMDSDFPAKDRFDDYSILFYVTENNNVVASCRITPYKDQEWEISQNLPDHLDLNIETCKAVQLNRVYIDESYRNKNLHAFMFYHFSEWVLMNTLYTTYFAICKLALVRLYKNIGASSVITDGFYLNGRAEHKYYLVAGEIADFNLLIQNKYLKKN